MPPITDDVVLLEMQQLHAFEKFEWYLDGEKRLSDPNELLARRKKKD